MNSNLCKIAALLCFCSWTPAQAGVASATQRLASDLGIQEAIDATATCDLDTMAASDGGNLATPNMLLCAIKRLGITGNQERTTTLTMGATTMNVHYKMSSPGLTADGVTYSHKLELWTCDSNCNTVNDYWPAIFVTFTASASRSVNKGILINNYAAGSGTLLGTSFIKWDMGTATENKSIHLNMVDCSNVPTFAGYSVYRRTGDIATLTNLYSNSSGNVNRTALAIDYSNNTGNYFEDTTVSAGGDTPTFTTGFTRSATATDWSYSGAAVNASLTADAFPTAISGATLSGASNQGFDCSTVTTNAGVTSVNDGSNILTTTVAPNGGMSTHPSSL